MDDMTDPFAVRPDHPGIPLQSNNLFISHEINKNKTIVRKETAVFRFERKIFLQFIPQSDSRLAPVCWTFWFICILNHLCRADVFLHLAEIKSQTDTLVETSVSLWKPDSETKHSINRVWKSFKLRQRISSFSKSRRSSEGHTALL